MCMTLSGHTSTLPRLVVQGHGFEASFLRWAQVKYVPQVWRFLTKAMKWLLLGAPHVGNWLVCGGPVGRWNFLGEKPKRQMKMKIKSAGHFLDGFGIFGPSRIHSRSFKTQILLLQGFEFRFAQTISTSDHCTTDPVIFTHTLRTICRLLPTST
jgi:hypothetical protein